MAAYILYYTKQVSQTIINCEEILTNVFNDEAAHLKAFQRWRELLVWAQQVGVPPLKTTVSNPALFLDDTDLAIQFPPPPNQE